MAKQHLFLSSFAPLATIVSNSFGIVKRWQAFAVHLQYIRKERSRDDWSENNRYLFTIFRRIYCEFQKFLFAIFASIFAYVWGQHQETLPKLVDIRKQVDNDLRTFRICYQRLQILGKCSEFWANVKYFHSLAHSQAYSPMWESSII